MAYEPTGGVAAVDRALTILAAFDGADEPLGISELARRTGLHKSTALRLVRSLKAHGFVMQSEGARYQLGPILLRLGAQYQRNNRLAARVVPVLEQLVRDGSESPSFYIRHGVDSRLCVFRVDSHHATLDRVRAGLLRPLDRGAAGHVFWAFDGTGTAPHHDEVRDRGYAVSFGETDPECAAVAAPVFDADDDLVGVLSISGPRNRFDESTVARQIGHLLPAAAALTRSFGGRAKQGEDKPFRPASVDPPMASGQRR